MYKDQGNVTVSRRGVLHLSAINLDSPKVNYLNNNIMKKRLNLDYNQHINTNHDIFSHQSNDHIKIK